MADAKRKWDEDETLFLFHLLLNESASSLSSGSPLVMDVAKLLNRSSGSVHRKLEDIRTGDPAYLARGKKGTHGASLIKEIWNSLYSDGYDGMMRHIDDAYHSIGGYVETSEMVIDSEIPPGTDVPVESTYRDGQQVFRRMVANNFDRKCCITGINIGCLLVASHIKPWSVSSPAERTDFRNGLYLNRLHDGLFDNHLMTLDEDFRIEFSDSILRCGSDDSYEQFFGRFEGHRIRKSAIPIDSVYMDEHRRIAYDMWKSA